MKADVKLTIPRVLHVFLAMALIVFSCHSKNDHGTKASSTSAIPKQVKSRSQTPSPPDFDASNEVKSAKTIVPGELLLRVLQFDAPYSGYFQELRLYRDGRALTFRNVPNWAKQASQGATLKESALATVRRSLAAADLSGYSASSMPQPTGKHTVLILFDGHAYQRRNFNGPLPASIQAPIDVVQKTLKEASDDFEKYRKANDAAREAERVLREGSGWNIPKEPQLTPLKDIRGLLLTVSGLRRETKTSVYHVLFFYPEGRLSYQPWIDRANWPGNPRAEVRLTFEHPNAASGIGITAVTHEFVIEYRVIESILKVADNSFPLTSGNLFVIQLDKNWTPTVRALHASVVGPSPASMILGEFKAHLRGDRLIQTLSLGG
jgi:hypothetical protein